MPTTFFRIYNGSERISTAILVGPRSNPRHFLQVKPFRKYFDNQKEWIASSTKQLCDYETITIVREDSAPLTLEARIAKRFADAEKRKRLLEQEPRMTKAVRALYDEFGLDNSLSASGSSTLCKNPGIFVSFKDKFMPVFFNRKTGRLANTSRNPSVCDGFEDANPDDVIFYYQEDKKSFEMTRVKPDLTKPGSTQKTIIIISDDLTDDQRKSIDSGLKNKGYFVKHLEKGPRFYWFKQLRDIVYDTDNYEVLIRMRGEELTFSGRKKIEPNGEFGNFIIPDIYAWIASLPMNYAWIASFPMNA